MTFKGDRIAAYARYSSDKQSEASIEDQLRRLRDYLARDGRQLDDRLVLTDYAVSGASTNRPGFDALMGMVRRREIDVLLVESVDRLSRNLADSSRMREEFDFYGVQLVAVADGIDTSNKSAKLTADIKSVFASMYLADLSDKTSRGMQGRALAKLSTGGTPLGYRSAPIPGADPRTATGRVVEIDPDGAAIVRRIFADYLAGGSIHGIALALNREQVPSPRDKTRHKRKTGWAGSSVRAILMNEKYAGVWTFGMRKWVKVPGTNRRVPQKADPSTVIRTERPELRIVDDLTWQRAKARLAATHALYTRTPDGKRKGKAPRTDHAHVLSGLLYCDACSSPMTIVGTSGGRRYYGCPSNRNGRCAVATSVRADVAKDCILAELRELISSPNAVARLRKRIAAQAGDRLRSQSAELKERRARLERTEKRIGRIVEAIADGERSPALSDALRDLEAKAATERTAIAAFERADRAPVALPDPQELVRRASDLEHRLTVNPAGARLELRALFKDEAIRLKLGADGVFTAHSTLFPLLLLAPESQTPLPLPGGAFYGRSSGGRIRAPK